MGDISLRATVQCLVSSMNKKLLENVKSPHPSPFPKGKEAVRLPHWLKRALPKGNTDHLTERTVQSLCLQTVCDHAKCPNRMECFARNTATFLILGSVCTRNCRFCSVEHGTPSPADPTEPERIAEAVAVLGLSHVVLTCVSRDDLVDGGVEQFVCCLDAIRRRCPITSLEVLPSDFGGNFEAVDRLADSLPDVYNYNMETVPRLFSEIRGPIPNFERSLEMFRRIKRRQPAIRLKSGLMFGLGETDREVVTMLHQLREAGCDSITLGQYLQPAPDCIAVQRFVPPEEFERWEAEAHTIGFHTVAAGPFVRSSYQYYQR